LGGGKRPTRRYSRALPRGMSQPRRCGFDDKCFCAKPSRTFATFNFTARQCDIKVYSGIDVIA
ncbi:hypothetical protein ALC60_10731, partial [Trachymyrmex zeteki]